MARPPQPPPDSAAQAALAASGREVKKPLRTARVSCWRMMPNVIGGQAPAQAGYPDARLPGMGSRNPMGVSGKPPGGICGTLVGYLPEVKILQVGPLVLWLALGGVDSGHGCG